MNASELFLVAQDKSNPEASREAMATLVDQNMGLVGSIARKFFGHNLEQEDIIQEGVIGLIRAIELFDATRGIAFSTYATYWIRQKILRALENQDLMIRVPVWARIKYPEMRKETIVYYGAYATAEDWFVDSRYTWETEETPSIDMLLKDLSDKERDILLRHNGVNTPNGQPMTLMALAKEYETSKQHIHQIYNKALTKTQMNMLHPNVKGNK